MRVGHPAARSNRPAPKETFVPEQRLAFLALQEAPQGRGAEGGARDWIRTSMELPASTSS